MTDIAPTADLEALRLAARTATYPNSVVERENIKRVDDEIFDKVRVHERHMANNATTFIEEHRIDLQASDRLSGELVEDVILALRERDANTGLIAARYEELRNNILSAIASLERADRESAWHAAKVEDPYRSYLTLVSKYPALKPAIRVQ